MLKITRGNRVFLFFFSLVLLQIHLSLLSHPAFADFDPDLRPILQNIFLDQDVSVSSADVRQGCAGGTQHRNLLRFELLTRNDGPGDLKIDTDPQCPSCALSGASACGDSRYQCSGSEGHDQPELANIAQFSVLSRRLGEVVTGHGQGICFEDTLCDVGFDSRQHRARDGAPRCTYLSSTCSADYPVEMGCQYVDVTDLPVGAYLLRVELNRERKLREASFDNNAVDVPFAVCERARGTSLLFGFASAQKREKFDTVTVRGELRRSQEVSFSKMLQPGFEISVQAEGVVHYRGFPYVEKVLSQKLRLGSLAAQTRCSRSDRWVHQRRPGVEKWLYRNVSGYADRSCSQGTGGVARAQFRKRSARTIQMVVRAALEKEVETSLFNAQLTVQASDSQACWMTKLPQCANTVDRTSSLRVGSGLCF